MGINEPKTWKDQQIFDLREENATLKKQAEEAHQQAIILEGERDGARIRAEQAETDLKLNASMLAKQCDMAREAESRLARLREAVIDHRSTSKIGESLARDKRLYAVLDEVSHE